MVCIDIIPSQLCCTDQDYEAPANANHDRSFNLGLLVSWGGCAPIQLQFHEDDKGIFGGYKERFWVEGVVSFPPS